MTHFPLSSQLLTAILAFLLSITSFSQTDPLSLDSMIVEDEPVTDAFNSSYVINNQSSNMMANGQLNVDILHRFGEFSEGAFNAFGFDYAAIRIGFEYGLTDRITVATGRTSAGKNADAHLKYRILTQTTGTPFSFTIVGFSSVAFSAVDLKRQNELLGGGQFINQLVYTNEIIFSRKFSKQFSLQVIPTFVHRNAATAPLTRHNFYAIGAGGRCRISERIHLTADYSYVIGIDNDLYQNPVALGIDIVTGGHTFQLYVTNTLGMIEKEFLTATTGRVRNGDLRFGFTVGRAFMLKRNVIGGKIN